ncbi:MAG TPA: IS1595 family transposase [Mycobacteriales bacterium]|nr:IS1595 family transposase [Mycobacteriales bacterium]
MAKQEFSIRKLADLIPTEADAYRFLEELRWSGDPDACPKCGGIGRCSFIKPANGVNRKTRTGSRSQRRVWFCGHCRKQFSVLTDTIFHGTKISIRTWVFVIFEFCSAKNSISAWEISRKYEITNESAWHMLHRIREAMKREPLAALFSGQVQADETWIGGEPRYRHASDKREPARNYAQTDKTPVFALVNYETREIRSRLVADVTGKTLLPAIQEQVDTARTVLHTDGSKSYLTVAPHMRDHEWVSHETGEYVRGEVSTNILEGFFSQLKRSLDGTHHHVSIEHLDRYLGQFDFMYTYCKRTDSERMRILIDRVAGRRLTYKPLAGLS